MRTVRRTIRDPYTPFDLVVTRTNREYSIHKRSGWYCLRSVLRKKFVAGNLKRRNSSCNSQDSCKDNNDSLTTSISSKDMGLP